MDWDRPYASQGISPSELAKPVTQQKVEMADLKAPKGYEEGNLSLDDEDDDFDD
jgi:hypothetical protein